MTGFFAQYPIIRLAVFYAAGIVIASQLNVPFLVFPIVLGLLFIAFVQWILIRKTIFQNSYYGITICLLFVTLGIFSYQIRLPEFQQNHYSHAIHHKTNQFVTLKIVESLKSDSYYYKYYANVLTIDDSKCKGKILLNIQKDSLNERVKSDDLLFVYGELKPIPKSLNPHQFEYSDYLKTQHVHHQLIISKEDINFHTPGKATLFGHAQNFRAKLINKLRETSLMEDERSIIQALILGEKKDISKELYEQYAAAGVVHILAVSGLHVGIFYVLLTFLLKPVTFLNHGHIIRSLLIVIILWGFAFLAGLSPSVMRAVSMFSFFALAIILQRRTSSVNTLFISFFILTLIDPMNLFHVGFQLSYSAVFFILWLHPLFKPLIYSKIYVFRELKSMLAVTISAQIGVLPFTLFYFHSFPGLFLLTNLVILPTLTLFMAIGITVVVLSYINSLPVWLSDLYNLMVNTLNNFVNWTAHQELFHLKEIYFPFSYALCTYLLVIFFIHYLYSPSRKRFVPVLLSFSVFIGVVIINKHSHTDFYIFHKSREPIFGYKKDKYFTLFVIDTSKNFRDYNFISSYISNKKIKEIHLKPLPKVFEYRGETVYVMDSTAILPDEILIDVLILTHSPKINLDRVIKNHALKLIVADGSNYPSYVKRWEETAKNKELPFHSTGQRGAYRLD